MGKKGRNMIPVFTLERQSRKIGKEISVAIKEVIDKGVFILGPKVEEFEREFAKYIGVKYAVGVASGTDALSLSLLSVGVEPGDEVILPANSYPTAFAVTAIGAVPKLVDIDPVTFTIDVSKIPSAITKKTRAIIPVHLYGGPADVGKIREIGPENLKISRVKEIREMGPANSGNFQGKGERKIYIIEDCAQAHGGEIKQLSNKYQLSNYPIIQREKGKDYEWRKVGSIGDVGCFSFYPTKNLGCFGDGGMVVTNNKEIADKVRKLRMYGEKKRYQSVLLGRNSRLDELQAAILLVKLKYLDGWNKRRKKIAELYYFNLTGPAACVSQALAPNSPLYAGLKQVELDLGSPRSRHPFIKLKYPFTSLRFPSETDYARHVYHLFVIRTKKRDRLKKYLKEKGIGTAIHYPTPVHLVPSFKYLGYKKGDFPESEKASKEILSLPMWPELKDEEVERVIEVVKEFLISNF